MSDVRSHVLITSDVPVKPGTIRGLTRDAAPADCALVERANQADAEDVVQLAFVVCVSCVGRAPCVGRSLVVWGDPLCGAVRCGSVPCGSLPS